MVPKENPADNLKCEVFTGGLSSGYFARGKASMPKQGDKDPWKGGVNYIFDLVKLYFRNFSTDSLEFTIKDKKTA